MTADETRLITQLYKTEVKTPLDLTIMKKALQGKSKVHVRSENLSFPDIVSLERKGYEVYKPFDDHQTVLISWE